MQRLVSNIIIGVGTLVAALAKWGGRLMDLLDLPEFGKKWDEFWTKIGVDEFELWFLAAIVVLLLLVNVPWRRIRQRGGQPKPLSEAPIEDTTELVWRDLLFIKERITSYESFDGYKDEYYRRIANIRNSDLTIFANEQINQWRRDFVNRAGILADLKSNPPSDRTEEARVSSELLAIWKSLDDALS